MRYEVETTRQFDKWFNKLKDSQVKARFVARFRMITLGHFGDHKKLAGNLFELRFFFGAGYRVYYTIQNGKVVLLLNGGDKPSQSDDIAQSKQLLKQLED